MRVIARSTLHDFVRRYPDTKSRLDAWYAETKHENWKSPDDLKRRFPGCRIVGKDRAIFNIMRNNYRLVVKINYTTGIVYIRFIGTHKEYDKINVEEI